MKPSEPFRPVDDSARALARQLLADAHFAALATRRPETDLPSISRIALCTDHAGQPVSLISDLAEHTRALHANPACALLVGEPGEKGDPLIHPRLTLHCTAKPVTPTDAGHQALRTRYLSLRPKAKLYADFADFHFMRFDICDGVLNGGFGKAWKMSSEDLLPRI